MNWKKRFVSQKLNVKFTLVIILFMVIPIGILAGILFYNMEKNVVSENTGYMEYTMERNKDAVATKINSINMSTQFFLSDEPLLEMLKRTKDGETFSAEEWYSFKNSDIVSLERLVNNNPLLYGVRVYASNDRVQEMMPILYAASRMEKQPWQSEETVTGWHYDFNDQIFNSYTMRQNRKILSLVTEIKDSDSGTLGMIEAAMTMENMFPSLYENIEDEWSCFLTEDGGCYFGEGDGEDENTGRQELLAEIMAQYTADEEIQTCYLKLQGQHLIVSYLPLQELNGTLLCVKNITSNIHHVYRMRNTFVAVMLVFLVVLTFFINAIVKHLLKQLYEILRAIRRVQGGDLDVVIEHCGPDEMGELGTQINKMLTRIKQLMDDNLKREMLVKNSEIRALQNQINAHFIYTETSKTYRNVLEEKENCGEIKEITDPFGEDAIDCYEQKVLAFVTGLQAQILSQFDTNGNQQKMKQAVAYIEEHYASDLNMAVVSNYLSMNYSLFSYSFKQYTGSNFVNYLRDIRMKEAKRLLAGTDMRIAEISQAVGYENEKHFMKLFKGCCGVSPSEYRRNMGFTGDES